jgi:hypothetical protein
VRVRLPDGREFVADLPAHALVAELRRTILESKRIPVGRLIVHGKVLFDEQHLSMVYHRSAAIFAMGLVEESQEPQTAVAATRERPIFVEFHANDGVREFPLTRTTHFQDVLPSIAEWLNKPSEAIAILIEENGKQCLAAGEDIVITHRQHGRFLVRLWDIDVTPF